MKNECASMHELGSLGMLPQRMRCCGITSSAIIGLKTLLQFPFHKHFERTWLIVLDTDSCVTCRLFINYIQLQGFPIDSHTFVSLKFLIILRDLVTVWE